VQSLELLHLFLQDADVIHEGDNTVGCHGTGVKSGRGEEWSNVERHGALRGVQYEQLTPAESK